jgi:uncharacterized membrane protein YkoI
MAAPRLYVLVVVLLAPGAGAALAPANAGASVAEAPGIRLAAAGISMDQAVKMVEERFKARVVRAEAQREDGRTIYVLRLLDDSGRVWTVRVDAESGAVL